MHKKAFEAIKQAIQKDCIMHYYNPKQRTVLTVDASPVGLGAILSSVDAQGNIHNVAYASRSLSKVEQKYSQTEREALAVVWGCEKFHLYLVGTKLTIVTDHKALEIIYNTKSKMPARIERWGLRLQQYDFDIQHRPGVGSQQMSYPDNLYTTAQKTMLAMLLINMSIFWSNTLSLSQ